MYSLNFIYIRVVVIDSIVHVIQYLVYFTLFMERECTDLKNNCFSSDFIFIIYIRVVGSVIQYLVYFCC